MAEFKVVMLHDDINSNVVKLLEQVSNVKIDFTSVISLSEITRDDDDGDNNIISVLLDNVKHMKSVIDNIKKNSDIVNITDAGNLLDIVSKAKDTFNNIESILRCANSKILSQLQRIEMYVKSVDDANTDLDKAFNVLNNFLNYSTTNELWDIEECINKLWRQSYYLQKIVANETCEESIMDVLTTLLY